MKLAVFASILLAGAAACNRGFSAKDAKQARSAAPEDQEVPFRDAANGNADAEVAIAIEPDAHAEDIEPAARADGEDANASHDKWAAAALGRGLNLAGPSVREAATPYAALDAEADVPVWTRKDLINGFAYLRDIMLTKADSASHARRLTWLYPDDGCYARAALGGFLLEYKGFKRPFNVFSFGNLSAKTPNHPKGVVNWSYHVAPVVEVDSVAWVLDPAIEPRRPVTLQEWLERQSANIGAVRVALCDGGSMSPNGLCRGGVEPARAALGYFRKTFYGAEERRQTELGRDPAQVLGAAPPWKTDASCGAVATATLTINVAAARGNDAVCVNGEALAGTGATRAYTSGPLCGARDTAVTVGYCADQKANVQTVLRGGTNAKIDLP